MSSRLLNVRTGFVALAAASLALTACGGSSSTTVSGGASATVSAATSSSASATPTVKPTTVTSMNAFKVTGGYGATPKVTAKWPLVINKTQVKVLTPSKGATVSSAATVAVRYYGVDARTGTSFDENFSKKTLAVFPLGQVITGFKTGIAGQRVGSRVVVAMTGADGYDSSGGQSSAGINVGDTLVFVIDIVSASLSGPSGTAVTPAAGLPTVTDSKGVPTVSIGSAKAPTSLVVQPLIKGTGAAVKSGDVITVHYTMVSFATGKVIENDYTSGIETGSLSSLTTSWTKGLVGQKVGSRVMLVVPAGYDYPNGNATPSIAKSTPLVYVVDLLMTTSNAG